jgi:RalA-binding protein 1
VQNAAVNKMTVRNVGIVFSPTLGIPAGVFSLMLGEFTRVFDVAAAGEDANGAPGDAPGEPEHAPVERPMFDRRNSKQYTDQAADRLLGLTGRQLAGAALSSTGGSAPPLTLPAAPPAHAPAHDEPEEAEDAPSDEPSEPDAHAQVPSTHVRAPSDADGAASRAQRAAQSRGLSLNTSPGADLRARRHSRMPGAPVVGLPTSPRPGHRMAQEPPAFAPPSPSVLEHQPE